ncbi:DUF397 domain-containing protein [Streptomyces sp. NPDC047718]|uniref:DUF397 domain-containing protein n=1 Tax=Streptomyces sp. NPDC047718 TaxID=3155479 RepID=UPI0033E53675
MDAWTKSSYSGGSESQCVEVADVRHTPLAGIAVRDSKRPGGAALLLTPTEFEGLILLAADSVTTA